MEQFFNGLGWGGSLLLIFSLLIALGFEFVNGFHDTANAVATVIYTRSLAPWAAVIWSGLWNFIGIFFGGIAVAYSIVNLLPVDLIASIGSANGMAMVFAMLIAAMLWNLGTWYLALPASSSHTLIGSILGIGLANSWLTEGDFGAGVNWGEAGKVMMALLLSPIIGFTLAALLLYAGKRFLQNSELFHEPPAHANTKPPLWIRAILITTCTGVSFAHGSNDGQKGIGLIMLILIGVLPGTYALNLNYSTQQIGTSIELVRQVEEILPQYKDSYLQQSGAFTVASLLDIQRDLGELRGILQDKQQLSDISQQNRWKLRSDILHVDKSLDKFIKHNGDVIKQEQISTIKKCILSLRGITNYAMTWVIIAVGLALGVGTTVGWKRIVVTVGQKIGKKHLTYAQGAVAESVAMTMIGISAMLGLPVSTTHVLSSGIAGAMFANNSGLQKKTLQKIGMAWVLTLPASIILSGSLFFLFREIAKLFA